MARREAYADAVAVYLSYLGSKLLWHSSLAQLVAGVEKVVHTFGRQALPMVWDFVDSIRSRTPLGNVSAQFDGIVRAVEHPQRRKLLPRSSGRLTPSAHR